MDATLVHLTFLRAYFGDRSDGYLRVLAGVWQWLERGANQWVNITTVAGKWTVSGSTLYLVAPRFQFASIAAPTGAELVFGAPSEVVMPLVKVAGVMQVDGTVRAEPCFSGHRTRAGVRKTTAGVGNAPTWQSLIGGWINTPAPSGSGGGCGTFAGGTGMTLGTDRPPHIIRTSAPMAVASSTTAGTTPAVNSYGGLAHRGYTYATAPRIPGADGFPGGGGALSQTGTGSYGGQGGGGATTSPEGTSKLGAFGGGVVQLQVRTLALGLSARIHADGESSGNGEAGSASGANLTIAGGGSGGAGGGGGQVLIQVGRLTIDGEDYTTRLTDSAVTSRITVAGGAAGTGGMGRTRLDSLAALTAWSASETVATGVFRKPYAPSPAYVDIALPAGSRTRVISRAMLPDAMLDADGPASSGGVPPALSAGGDVWASVGGEQIPLHVAYFATNNNPASAEGELWVKMPNTSAATVRIHWHGSQVSQPVVNSTYGRNAVFSEFRAFWRACLDPVGGGVKMIDWTGNGYDGSISGSNAWVLSTGQIGRCWYQTSPFGDTFPPITTSTPITDGMTGDRTILVFMTAAISSTGSEARMFLEEGTNGTLLQVQRGPADYQNTLTGSFAGVYLQTYAYSFTGVASLFALTLNSLTANLWINDVGAASGTATNTTSSATTNAYMGERFRAPTLFSLLAVANSGFDQMAMTAWSAMLHDPTTGSTTGTPQNETVDVGAMGFVALAPGGTTGIGQPTWPTGAGQSVVDGTVTWVAAAVGSNASNPAFSGGDGVAGSAGVRVIERVQI